MTMAVFDRNLLRRRRDRAAVLARDYDFLLQETAERLTERLDAVRRALPVMLDLGSAHGVMSEKLTRREGTSHVISADLSYAMAQASCGLSVVADEEFFPFAPESLDAVVSNLSLHWVNDLPGALLQIRRALKPDGLFLAAFLGGESLRELRACLMEAEMAVTGGASPRVSPFASLQDAAVLMQRAGFALPVVDSDIITVRYKDAFRLMRDLRGMGAADVAHGRSRRFVSRRVMVEAARIYAERHQDAQGLITASFEVIFAIGWAPHESQQQPLTPGSAKAKLADALQAIEMPAGEKVPR